MASVDERTFSKYMNSLKKSSLLSREEELKLARKYKKTGNKKYGDQLITANLRFVAKVAYKWYSFGYDMMDLIQEGNKGLIVALDKFDPERGYRFISYAVWWIKAYIKAYVMSAFSQVKMGTSESQRTLFFRLRSEKAKLASKSSSVENLYQELSEIFGESVANIKEMDMRMASRDFSLQFEIHAGDRDHVTPQDLLEDTSPNQDELVEKRDTALCIRDIIDKLELNAKEKYIVEHRLMNPEPAILQDIGDTFGITRERIRQIEVAVKDKIKHAIMEKNPELQDNAQSTSDLHANKPKRKRRRAKRSNVQTSTS